MSGADAERSLRGVTVEDALSGALPLAEGLVSAAGGSVCAVMLYGSHLLNTAPGVFSAYDFVVVVDDYGAFYRAMKRSRELHRSAWLMAALSNVLPPNVIAFTPDDGRHGVAKCLLVRWDHFERALGPHPPDHFLLGRMVQKVALIWFRSPSDARRVEEALDGARMGILDWVAPYLDGTFDAETVGRRLLQISYGGELRPEAVDRSERVFEAQRDYFRESLGRALAAAERAGRIRPAGDRSFRLVRPPAAAERRHWRSYFRRSKRRSTARWFKHVITFDNWLPYIARKVERRTGIPVELTPWERRAPLIFLWPRVMRVLRGLPEQERS